MAISYRGITQAYDASFGVSSLNIAAPSGTVANDGEEMWVSVGALAPANPPLPNTPANWTSRGSSSISLLAGGLINLRVTLFTRARGTTVQTESVSTAGGVNALIAITRKSFQNTESAGYFGQVNFGAQTSASTTLVVPSQTTTRDNSYVSYQITQSTAQSVTPPGSLTERVDNASTGISNHDAIQATAGAVGTRTFTFPSAAQVQYGYAEYYSEVAAVGAAAGVGSASGVGAATKTATGAATGTSTAAGVSAATAESVGAATGTASAAGIGASTAEAVGGAAGSSTADGVGLASTGSTGAADGTSTASGVGAAMAEAVGSSAGAGAAAGIGASTAETVGAAEGAGTAEGIGSSVGAGEAAGSAAGTSAAAGVGAALAAGTGTAAGFGEAIGISPEVRALIAAIGAPGGRRRPSHYAVIDGVTVYGDRDEILRLVARQARQDARAEPPQPSLKKAKAVARKAVLRAVPRAGVTAPSMASAVTLQPTDLLRDVRAEYVSAFSAAMAELIRRQIEDDNQAAIAAAEMML